MPLTDDPFLKNCFHFKDVVQRGLALLFILILIQGCKKEITSKGQEKESVQVVRQASEYEHQDALWLIWPPADHTREYANDSVTIEIIKAVSPHQKVVITAASDSLTMQAKQALNKTFPDLSGIELLTLPSEELWIRDMGPNFVTLNNGETGIADFRFNAWGYSTGNDPYTATMEAYDREVAKHKGFTIVSSNLISEGGNREMNSQGILMLTEDVTLGRNPDWTREEIEKELKRMLGARKIIWLKHGLVEDQHSFLGPVNLGDGEKAYTVVTTNGHIDEYARFANDSTILLADIPKADLDDPLGSENKRRMEANLKILQAATDINGDPFHIVRVPMPKPILKTMRPGDPVYDYLSTLEYTDGSTFPEGKPIKTIAAASYLNFIITNKVIIAQKYGSSNPEDPNNERDESARMILQEQFPNHQVISLDAISVNLGGGGLHCISMQEPSMKRDKSTTN